MNDQDFCKDKLMYQVIKTKAFNMKLYTEFGTHWPEDYFTVKEFCNTNGYTTAFCIKNVNEIRIDVPDGWCVIDAWGEIIGAGGKYEKFLELNSGVTELENMMNDDVKKIYGMKYDLTYLEDIRDIEDISDEIGIQNWRICLERIR